jgi:hypothetical protein
MSGPRETIRSYRELRVYQAAMEPAMEIFGLIKSIQAAGSPRRHKALGHHGEA